MKVLDYDPQNKLYPAIYTYKHINNWGKGKALFYNGIPISMEEKRETKTIRQTALNYFMQDLSMNAKISEWNYEEWDIFKATKYLPTRYLLITKGKIVTWE